MASVHSAGLSLVWRDMLNKSAFQRFRPFAAQYGDEFLRARAADARKRTEMGEQLFARRRANPGNIFERRMRGVPFFGVIRIHEPMYLVADGLQEAQRVVMPVKRERLFAVWQKEEFLLFGERRDREGTEAQRKQRLARGVELPAPAVDQDEIREGLVFIHEPLVAPPDRFLYRGKIILSRHAPDNETAVIFCIGASIFEMDAGGHVGFPQGVRDIKGFDIARR